MYTLGLTLERVHDCSEAVTKCGFIPHAGKGGGGSNSSLARSYL